MCHVPLTAVRDRQVQRERHVRVNTGETEIQLWRTRFLSHYASMLDACLVGGRRAPVREGAAVLPGGGPLLRTSQLPHKSVNVSFTTTNIKNKLTDLCGS